MEEHSRDRKKVVTEHNHPEADKPSIGLSAIATVPLFFEFPVSILTPDF